MFLFADQLEYDEPMQEKVQRMAQFLLLFYVVAWLRAPVAEDAPANDLNLYRSLVRYRHVNFQTLTRRWTERRRLPSVLACSGSGSGRSGTRPDQPRLPRRSPVSEGPGAAPTGRSAPR
ncbi:hypothetical protein FJT64_001231 [Amphibalanus amphitrite]|uniref:Uncharacterized protein n=1 Tax=Amphibalanus amphitrite TaxID=1232801 RepID=A0A6A4VFG5_AMPAM|nr:hypothetical protein FJT64_001231 [Amphibalanus amphitrite]